MYDYHPKLINHMTKQTPRAMAAMIVVSLMFIAIFYTFIPFNILLIWLVVQILLAMGRLYNTKILNAHIEHHDIVQIKQQVRYFKYLNVIQAMTWTSASLFVVSYAPPPFEFVTFIMVIGIITAGLVSMSSIFSAYLIFFLLMIIPQIFIMVYFGGHEHIAVLVFLIIYMPAIVLLSKSINTNYQMAIKNNDELQMNIQKLKKLSTTDSLTNIYNRRYFFEVAEKMITTSLQEKKLLSFLMLDIDFFKHINDTYGHQAGDFILMTLAKEIKELMRKNDIFARVGGEEFAIILENTSIKEAQAVAEKIRKHIAKKDFIFDGTTIDLTVSIGVASLNESSLNIETLYNQADQQLYKAKQSGRNRVC